MIEYNLLNIEYSQPVIFTNLGCEIHEITKISGLTVLLNYVYIYYMK